MYCARPESALCNILADSAPPVIPESHEPDFLLKFMIRHFNRIYFMSYACVCPFQYFLNLCHFGNKTLGFPKNNVTLLLPNSACSEIKHQNFPKKMLLYFDVLVRTDLGECSTNNYPIEYGYRQSRCLN